MIKLFCDKCGRQEPSLGVVSVTRVFCGPGPHIQREWCDRCIETLIAREWPGSEDPESIVGVEGCEP